MSISIKQLADKSPDDAKEKGLYVIRFLITAAASFTILLSGYVAWYASRVLTTGHNPPLGYWIIQDQKIHTGQKARMTGYAPISLSILLTVLVIGSLIIGFRLIETLITP